jgi:hypothetical protein
MFSKLVNTDFLCLLQHPFFQSETSKSLALKLLHKVNNPSHIFTELEADDDGVSNIIISVSVV